MSFLSSLKKVASTVARATGVTTGVSMLRPGLRAQRNPFSSIAGTTTGGASFFAPPAVQAAIGRGIVGVVVPAGAGALMPGAGAATNQALQASDEYGSSGPWNPPRRSPSSYSQLTGARRMRRRRGGYMVSPPAAGLPPSSTGFIERPRDRMDYLRPRRRATAREFYA